VEECWREAQTAQHESSPIRSALRQIVWPMSRKHA
jgi:hypothetical protein